MGWEQKQPSAESPDDPVSPNPESLGGPAEYAAGQSQEIDEETRLREDLKWFEALTFTGSPHSFNNLAEVNLERLREINESAETFSRASWDPSPDHRLLLTELYDIRLRAGLRTEPTPIEAARAVAAQELYSDLYSQKLSLLEQQAHRPTSLEANEAMRQTRRELVSRERIVEGLRELSDGGRGQASTSLSEAEVDLGISRQRHEANQKAFLEAQDRVNQINDWAEQVGLTSDEVAGHFDRYARSQRIELAHEYVADQVFSPHKLIYSVDRALPSEHRLVYGLKSSKIINQKVVDRLGGQVNDDAYGEEFARARDIMEAESLFDLVGSLEQDKPAFTDYQIRQKIADQFQLAIGSMTGVVTDRAAIRVNGVYDDFHQARLNEQAQLLDQIPADLLKLFKAEG